MHLKIVTATFLLMVLNITSVYAETYHVSNSGNDNYPGSFNLPWQTTGKVNSFFFKPDDQILFKRGDIWNEPLIIGASGSKDASIVFGAYGKGTKPIIDVKNQVKHCIGMNEKSYVNIEHFDLRNSQEDALVIDNCFDIIISHVDIYKSGTNGLISRRGGKNIRIDAVRIFRAAENGIQFTGSALDPIRDVIVENCEIYDVDKLNGIVVQAGTSDGAQAGNNFIIRNNYITGCGGNGFEIVAGSDIFLENNISEKNNRGALIIGHTANSVTVRCHQSINEPTSEASVSVKIKATNVKLEYNIFRGNVHQFLEIGYDDLADPRIRGFADNVEIYNNIFIGSVRSGTAFRLKKGATITSFKMKNNIWMGEGGGLGRFCFDEPTRTPDYSGFEIDHNIYFDDSGAQWNVLGVDFNFMTYRSLFFQDDNSIFKDPMFVDASSLNYHPTKNSPAINAGIDVNLNEDFEGNRIPQGFAPDIGAFELIIRTTGIIDKQKSYKLKNESSFLFHNYPFNQKNDVMSSK